MILSLVYLPMSLPLSIQVMMMDNVCLKLGCLVHEGVNGSRGAGGDRTFAEPLGFGVECKVQHSPNSAAFGCNCLNRSDGH